MTFVGSGKDKEGREDTEETRDRCEAGMERENEREVKEKWKTGMEREWE